MYLYYESEKKAMTVYISPTAAVHQNDLERVETLVWATN